MNPAVVIRRATIADLSIIARHRAEMFTDMGQLPPDFYQPLVEETKRFLEAAIWAKASDLDTLVLHASPDGRHLYQRLGFLPTNEMKYNGWLGTRPS